MLGYMLILIIFLFCFTKENTRPELSKGHGQHCLTIPSSFHAHILILFCIFKTPGMLRCPSYSLLSHMAGIHNDEHTSK